MLSVIAITLAAAALAARWGQAQSLDRFAASLVVAGAMVIGVGAGALLAGAGRPAQIVVVIAALVLGLITIGWLVVGLRVGSGRDGE